MNDDRSDNRLESAPPPLDPLNAFLIRYWHDHDQGGVASLDEYLRLFPGDEAAIRREYETLRAGFPAEAGQDPTRSGLDEQIGPYQLLREIGRGGQGVVYLAVDRRLQRQVAVKVLTGFASVHPEILERFLREARIASRLDHPGICGVLEAGVESGIPFIAMRYLEGETLARRIQNEREGSAASPLSTMLTLTGPGRTHHELLPDNPTTLPTRVALPSSTREDLNRRIQIIENAARALHVAHESGIIHRDIKPGNIMLTALGNPVILDFGLARIDDPEFESLTRTGDFFGTPAYMSPEQLAATNLQLDRRTDVFSLGACLFETLTLTRPFEGPTREALYEAIRTQDPPSLHRRLRSAPRDLTTVVATALEKDRNRRYQTALDLALDLQRVRENRPIAARPAGTWTRLARWAKRSPALATAMASTFLALTAGLVLALKSAHTETRLRSEAELQSRRADGNLAEYERFADLQRLDEVILEARHLWPAVPALIPAFDRWLGRVQDLESRLADHMAALQELRRRGVEQITSPELPEELRPGKAAIEALRRQLAAGDASESSSPLVDELVDREQELAYAVDPSGKIPEVRSYSFPDSPDLQWRHDRLTALVTGIRKLLEEDSLGITLSGIRKRRADALVIEQQSLITPAAEWRDIISRIESQPHYKGVKLRPLIGLVPLGMNPQGFAEFWLPQSGRKPETARATGECAITLVLLPGGVFTMGSPEDEEDRESVEELHLRNLAPYFLGKFEVTQGQWSRLMGSNPSEIINKKALPPSDQDLKRILSHPVDHINWYDAEGFARRLGLSLPTEAQWEYACRAGSKTAYPWGDEIGRIPQFNTYDLTASQTIQVHNVFEPAPFDDGYGWHAPVDAFPANAFGICEMPGNVSEWCLDRPGSYPLARRYADSGLRLGPPSDERVHRGGTFMSPYAMARSARRFKLFAPTKAHFLGMRVALTAPE